MLQILSQHADVWGEIRLIASPRSAGRKLAVRGEETEVVALTEEAFDGVDVALFLTYPTRCPRVGADRRGQGRGRRRQLRRLPDGPGRAAGRARDQPARRTDAAARASSPAPTARPLSMIVAVGALHAEFGLRELVVSSYQAVERGRAGTASTRCATSCRWSPGTELGDASPVTYAGPSGDDTGPVRRRRWRSTSCPGPERCARTAGPPRSWRSATSPARSSDLPNLPVAATCVHVPVVTTHSLTVHARFENEVDGRPGARDPGDRARCGAVRQPGRRRLPHAGRCGGHRPDLGGAGAAVAGRSDARWSCSSAATTSARARR